MKILFILEVPAFKVDLFCFLRLASSPNFFMTRFVHTIVSYILLLLKRKDFNPKKLSKLK